jgi:hypothetical protein
VPPLAPYIDTQGANWSLTTAALVRSAGQIARSTQFLFALSNKPPDTAAEVSAHSLLAAIPEFEALLVGLNGQLAHLDSLNALESQPSEKHATDKTSTIVPRSNR